MADTPATPTKAPAKAPKSDAKNPSLAEAATLDEETQAALLARTMPNSGTASGVAAREASSDAPDQPEGADRGNTRPIVPAGEGLTSEKAIVTPSGTLAPGFVGSPSGPVPVSVRAGGDPEKAAKLLKDRNESIRASVAFQAPAPIDEETLGRMSAAEIRAVAHDRGYDVGFMGRKAAARKFLQEQGEDSRLAKSAPKGAAPAKPATK